MSHPNLVVYAVLFLHRDFLVHPSEVLATPKGQSTAKIEITLLIHQTTLNQVEHKLKYDFFDFKKLQKTFFFKRMLMFYVSYYLPQTEHADVV